MKDTLLRFNYYKLVIFKVVNGFLLVVAMSFLAATDGVDWEAFTTFQKLKLAVFCLVAGGKFLEGFFDQTLSKMEPPPLYAGDKPKAIPKPLPPAA